MKTSKYRRTSANGSTWTTFRVR